MQAEKPEWILSFLRLPNYANDRELSQIYQGFQIFQGNQGHHTSFSSKEQLHKDLRLQLMIRIFKRGR